MELNLEMKVLIIDDLSTVRRIMRKLLTEIGFKNIEEASDGEAAWKMIEGGNFNLVLSDWNTPKLQGLELAQRVRADDRFKSLPFIMITANNTKEHVIKAAENGVSGYICKPFTIDVLKAKILEIFKQVENKE